MAPTRTTVRTVVRRRRAAQLLVATVLLTTACGGGGDAPGSEGATADADTAGERLATAADEGPDDGRGGGGGDDDPGDAATVPPYDAEDQRTQAYEGRPEPCLLLTPALVADLQGPFDTQQLLDGPACVYLSAEPLFETSLRTVPTTACDQLVDDAAVLDRPVEDETVDGRIVSTLRSDGATSALLYDDDWCLHLRVLHSGTDPTTVGSYVEAVIDALG